MFETCPILYYRILDKAFNTSAFFLDTLYILILILYIRDLVFEA